MSLIFDALMNFTQGSVWRKKQKDHESQIVLPIFLFFDDYEVGNPLGNHFGIHKLGTFHLSDQQKFGYNIIFKPVIDELNFLRETGIDIDTMISMEILSLSWAS
ncbi:SAM domain-containing protein [Aphis craccivora]|uniref:SAM domain-containing protein n=1 Tax=Aphis craccivora TaxID=307492 RepID=A0A6G0VZZ7_APHCR|nr:SAM domain-containing protein [Aphis craccivora]